MSKRNSVYVIINKNYTATVYSLQDLKDYVERENLDAGYFSIHKEDNGNPELTEEIKKYIQSFIVVEGKGVKRVVISGLYANYEEDEISIHFTAKEVAERISAYYSRCTEKYTKELEEKANWDILNELDYREPFYWSLSADFETKCA